jgi:hypothetical protein
MGYKVKWIMKPRPGHHKRKYATLEGESRYTYKTKEGAEKEAHRIIAGLSPYEKKAFIVKSWVVRAR